MTALKKLAPEPGKRLLAQYVDYLAMADPSRRFALIPRSEDVNDGFREVTVHDIARAANSMSWWIEKHLGPPTEEETIAYMGNNDIRYIIFILASNKTGNKVYRGMRSRVMCDSHANAFLSIKILFPSPRLSDEAYKHIFDSTNCKRMLFSQEKAHKISELVPVLPEMNFLEVPSFIDSLDDEGGLNHYPLEKTYEEIEDEVAFMIHSSGTTGKQ